MFVSQAQTIRQFEGSEPRPKNGRRKISDTFSSVWQVRITLALLKRSGGDFPWHAICAISGTLGLNSVFVCQAQYFGRLKLIVRGAIFWRLRWKTGMKPHMFSHVFFFRRRQYLVKFLRPPNPLVTFLPRESCRICGYGLDYKRVFWWNIVQLQKSLHFGRSRKKSCHFT